MKYLMYALITLLLFQGCSKKSQPAPKQSISKKSSSKVQKLYQHYNNWRGTEYAYGGLSRSGIDCSGFIYTSYKKLFNITLPRTTDAQVKQGKRVYINELAAGDLIFFKTGKRTRHVGIYIEKGKFVHASTSQGVTISRIDNVYWKKHYWQARRLF